VHGSQKGQIGRDVRHFAKRKEVQLCVVIRLVSYRRAAGAALDPIREATRYPNGGVAEHDARSWRSTEQKESSAHRPIGSRKPLV